MNCLTSFTNWSVCGVCRLEVYELVHLRVCVLGTRVCASVVPELPCSRPTVS
jgi:hypothetical protein